MPLQVLRVVWADNGREAQVQKVATLEHDHPRARLGSPVCLTARPLGSRPLLGAVSG